MKSIRNIIKETVLEETNSTIKIDESHFFTVIVDSKNKKKFYNFLVFVTAIIISIVVIINSLIFFINDILLYPNNPTINKEGAIIPERSCNRQSVLFLFNSAERWANTGVQLQEGDEIKISYSGGFHSDVAGLKQAAKDNYRPKYEWINFTTKSEPDTTALRKKLLYNKEDDAYFGSVLYTIAGEFGVQDDERESFRQIEKDKLIKIKRNGTLFLSVNDIYLRNSVIEIYEDENKQIFKTEIITKQELENKNDSISLYYIKNDSTVYVSGIKFREYFQNDSIRDIFFNDNLGAILVLIDINRKVSFLNWRTSWYRFTENTINACWDNSTGWLLPFIKSVGWFIFAVIILVFWKLWFITYPLILLLCFPYIKNAFKFSFSYIKNIFSNLKR